jgi:hypothetical protein
VPVQVQRRLAGTTAWQPLESATTTATGQYVVSTVVDQAAAYRAVSAGTTSYLAATSPPQALTLHPRIAVRLLTTPVLPATVTIARGSSTRLSGRLVDASGVALPERHVQLWRRVPGSTEWHFVTRTLTGSTGSFAFTVAPQGTRDFEVRRVMTARYLAGETAPLRVAVR